MKVSWGIENSLSTEPTICTVGSYDGVHLGHEKIIAKLLEEKQALGLERALLVTFHPHPQQVLQRGGASVQLLTTIEERLDLLSKTGIDEVVVLQFDEAFSQKSYTEFFEEILLQRLSARALVVGFNHAFGKNREGDAARLMALGAERGIPVFEVGPLSVDGVSLSSTKIRRALEAGDLATANRYLNRSYTLSGQVQHGDHVGTALGYPTANLLVSEGKLLPAEGVYACSVEYSGRMLNGALSIGKRPTIGENLALAVEVFLLDFQDDLYGASLTIHCKQFLRPQATFGSLEALKTQIGIDVAECRVIFSN